MPNDCCLINVVLPAQPFQSPKSRVPVSLLIGSQNSMLVDPVKTLQPQVLNRKCWLIKVLGLVDLLGGRQDDNVSLGLERYSAVFG